MPEALSAGTSSQSNTQNFPLVDVAVPEVPVAEAGCQKGVLAVQVVAVAVGLRVIDQGAEIEIVGSFTGVVIVVNLHGHSSDAVGCSGKRRQRLFGTSSNIGDCYRKRLTRSVPLARNWPRKKGWF